MQWEKVGRHSLMKNDLVFRGLRRVRGRDRCKAVHIHPFESYRIQTLCQRLVFGPTFKLALWKLSHELLVFFLAYFSISFFAKTS